MNEKEDVKQVELNEQDSTDESLKTEEQKEQVAVEKVPYERFKSVNDAKKAAEQELEQLRAQIANQEAEKAKEEGRFKDLYEAELAKREAAEKAKTQLELDHLKAEGLAKAGFTGERLEKAKKFVVGSSPEEIQIKIAEFSELIPAESYIDPSVNAPGGQKVNTQTSKDKAEEIGREAARRFFKKK